MSTQTIRPTHHVSPKYLLIGLVGTALAVSAGFGVAALTLDEQVAVTPGQVVVDDPKAPPGSQAEPGSDAHDGTNREVRELMHRR